MSWVRLAAVLGLFWSYITPEYLFGEMTMPEVNEYLGYVPNEYKEHIVIGAKQDLGWLLKNRVGTVVRK